MPFGIVTFVKSLASHLKQVQWKGSLVAKKKMIDLLTVVLKESIPVGEY